MSILQKTCIVVAILAGLGAGYLYGSRGIPFVGTYVDWSIGVYLGPEPLQIGEGRISNPVLTSADVTDVNALFVADPFLFKHGDNWHLFFEVLNFETQQGDIAVASSRDLEHWQYGKLVLDEDFHLSFPRVFEFRGEHYMVPETNEVNQVRLYRATNFPFKWTFERVLITGQHADPMIFQHAGRWWMYSSTASANNVLRLYHANSLTGAWQEHPRSPIVYMDSKRARPAGSVLQIDDRLIRFAQDGMEAYGTRVRAFEVLRLTETEYSEQEIVWSALQASGNGWNAEGMHHVDLHRLEDGTWAAAVDGWRYSRRYGFGL